MWQTSVIDHLFVSAPVFALCNTVEQLYTIPFGISKHLSLDSVPLKQHRRAVGKKWQHAFVFLWRNWSIAKEFHGAEKVHLLSGCFCTEETISVVTFALDDVCSGDRNEIYELILCSAITYTLSGHFMRYTCWVVCYHKWLLSQSYGSKA